MTKDMLELAEPYFSAFIGSCRKCGNHGELNFVGKCPKCHARANNQGG